MTEPVTPVTETLDPAATPDPHKPGYKTFAFYGALILTAFGALAASGSDVGGIGSVGFLLSSLGAAGFTAWRGFKKSENPKKPAWKTSEFYLSLGAAAVAGVYASGYFSDASRVGKIVATVAGVLAMLGYAVQPRISAVEPVPSVTPVK